MEEYYLMQSNGKIASPSTKEVVDFLVENDYAVWYRDIEIDESMVHYYAPKEKS